jgi:hypothetical protein
MVSGEIFVLELLWQCPLSTCMLVIDDVVLNYHGLPGA